MSGARRPIADSMRLRARDSDRDAVLKVLDAAFANGQLSEVEHEGRLESAAAARTLADLDGLVRDLQIPSELQDSVPTPPRDRSVRWIAALAAVAALVVGGVVVASGLSDSGSSGDSVSSSDTAASSADLTTAAGLGRLLDEIPQKFGDSVVDELDVYPEFAQVERQVPGKPGMSQSYTYKVDKGEARFEESGTPSPRSDSEVPVDLAPLRPNVPTLIGLLYGADRTLAVADPTSTHISIEQGEQSPEAEIYLTNAEQGTSGFLTMGFDGEVRAVRRADR
ncbi:DUF1707 SHOCT-like domain-containing protein [Prescottella agglutinans]|nr:DUF1707 domain-containing protein [Prescottella agglutinans]